MRQIARNIVGAVIISNDGKVLLGHNAKGGILDDHWVIPGGGIDEGEDRRSALVREVREELGLDVTSEKIVDFESVFTGSAEKTLRENGERVMVTMTFYDSAIYLAGDARDITLVFDDDFESAQFFAKSELVDLKISSFTERRLEELGLIGTDE